MKLRAVIDTNVFLSAFMTPRGTCGSILRQILNKQSFDLILSRPILAELKRTLQYKKIKKRLKLTPEDLEKTLTALEWIADLVVGDRQVSVDIADPDDKIYLAAALEGRGQYIVTGDSDLLSLGEFENISIVTPKDFFNLL